MKKRFIIGISLLTFMLVGCTETNKVEPEKEENDVEVAKKSAAEVSTQNIVKAAEIEYMSQLMSGNSDNPMTISANELNVKNKPIDGSIVITNNDGNLTIEAYGLIFDSYKCDYKNSEVICKSIK